MYIRDYENLITNKLFSDSQFGCRSGHSCSDALLSILSRIWTEKNKGNKVCIVTLDLKKAFDTVSHDILLYKLYKKGLTWNAIEWFSSYLSNRKQCVRTKDVKSKFNHVKVGVPQGSILGPLLFNLYIDGITKLNLKGDLTLYADDCTIVMSDKTYAGLGQICQHNLDIINQWMSENRLAINADKSNYVIMDLNNRASLALDLKIGSQDLPKAYETKILGVVIDNRLSFKSHIDNTCNKVRQRIGVLKKTRHCLPVPALNLVYRSIIQPIIDYGITVYGFTYKTHTDRILSL